MAKRVGMEVTTACAEAAALCRIDVASVYPITPSLIMFSTQALWL